MNAWDYLVADKTLPHPKHMLAGTTGHEGTGANGGKGRQGRIDMILGRGIEGCGDAAAMAEGIVAETENEARLLVEGKTPGNIREADGDSHGIEDHAHNALELGMSRHHVYGHHADSSVFVYKDLSDNSYNSHPHRDLKGPKPVDRPLHSVCRSYEEGPGITGTHAFAASRDPEAHALIRAVARDGDVWPIGRYSAAQTMIARRMQDGLSEMEAERPVVLDLASAPAIGCEYSGHGQESMLDEDLWEARAVRRLVAEYGDAFRCEYERIVKERRPRPEPVKLPPDPKGRRSGGP